jgi:hypothetical protein
LQGTVIIGCHTDLLGILDVVENTDHSFDEIQVIIYDQYVEDVFQDRNQVWYYLTKKRKALI